MWAAFKRMLGLHTPHIGPLTIGVTAIQLRTVHREGHITMLEVLYEDEQGRWRKVIQYATEHQGVISHIVEVGGMAKAPVEVRDKMPDEEA